jgi:UDP-N-acetylmuramoylalanine--D-glutamate ligase
MGQTALALVRLLESLGARPFVTESSESTALDAAQQELARMGVPFEIGGHTSGMLEGAAMLVPSPGVSPRILFVADAVAKGIPICSELEFASRYCGSKMIAVTGTNGKTTTTELLKAMIEACGHSVLLAGNNSLPLSDAVLAETPPEYMVVEASSYQLDLTRTFRPWIGVVLNVTPDHMARHGSMEAYSAAKAKVFANLGADGIGVVNEDDPLTLAMVGSPAWERVSFSACGAVSHGAWLDGETIVFDRERVAETADIPLKGGHNVENVLASIASMAAGGFDLERAREGLRGFHGVEHRIEYVAEAMGVKFYNDSKSTNLDSLRVALKSFDEPVVLIAGGEGKGSDYGKLTPLVSEHVAHLVTLGEDAPLLEAAYGDRVPTTRAADMEDALRIAAKACAAGRSILLSPGCASFDMYRNFEERGEDFKKIVRGLVEEIKMECAARPSGIEGT